MTKHPPQDRRSLVLHPGYMGNLPHYSLFSVLRGRFWQLTGLILSLTVVRRSSAAGCDVRLEHIRLLSVNLEIGHRRGGGDTIKNQGFSEKQHHTTNQESRAWTSAQMSIWCLIYSRRHDKAAVSVVLPSVVMMLCLIGGSLRFHCR